MEHAKKFLGGVLVVVAGMVVYNLVVSPIISKAKTAMPATA